MIRLVGSAPTASPAGVMMRTGGVVASGAGLVAAAALLLVSPRAAGSALVGAGLATVALAVGPLLLAASRTLSPPAVMAIALAGYLATVIVLAVVYVILGQVGWLSGDHVGLGILAAAVGSLAGQLWAVSHLRLLAFGNGTEGDASSPDAAPNGSPASPSGPSH